MPRLKFLSIQFLALCLASSLAAQSAEGEGKSPLGAEMAGEGVPQPAAPSYGLLMFGETFLPGSAQIYMGYKVEGIIELSLSLPLIGAGQGLIWYYYLAPQNGESSPLLRDGYPYAQDAWYSGRRWMLELGLCLDAAGRAAAAYSAWSARREYFEKYGDEPIRRRESLGQLAAAPFLPENILSFETLPVIALVGLSSFPKDGLARIEDFFAAPSQPVWGIPYQPAAAFALKALDVLAASFFSAVARELLFRGLILEQDGIVASIGLSSAYSLVSMAVPGSSTADLALGAASEAAYSWYAGALTLREGGPGKAIALRYWCETASSLIGYLMDPEALPPLSASISVRY